MKLVLFPFFAACLFPAVIFLSSGALAEEKTDEMEAYDPFTDYSEFENPEEEDRNIRFFKGERFFSIGFYGGMRFFTGQMVHLLKPGFFNVGAFINYFINLTTSLQFTFLHGSHDFFLKRPDIETLQARFGYHNFGVDIKHHFDKKKLIPFIAFFNPYVFIGCTYTRRPGDLFEADERIRNITGSFGARAGLGIEIHFSKKFFMGILGDFNYVTFEDEGIPIPALKKGTDQIVSTGIPLSGDMIHALFMFGAHF